MATTGFWPVKGRLKEVIDYAENPNKTTAREYLDENLYAALRYVEDDEKTDKAMFVSSINCSKHNAYQEMMAVKHRFGERGTNIAYHGYQSFASGEVTPKEAHQIGLETARRMWGEKYQVIVTTHLNTDNVHNHFVVNSVSFKDGKKFRNGIGDRLELRKISDSVCRMHRKKVLENSPFYSNKKEYWVQKSGNLSHRDMLRKDLDEALSHTTGYVDLAYYLQCLGYRFERDFRYEHPSVIADGWKRPVRIDKLGERFTTENIRKRLLHNQRTIPIYAITYPNRKQAPLLELEVQMRQDRKKDTIQLLFEIFILLLKLCIDDNVQQSETRPLSPAMRAEVRKLDEYTAEFDLLSKNHIETAEQLISFRDNLTERITKLESKRAAIRNQIRRAKTPEEEDLLKEQAKEITKKITPLRKQRQSSIRILERSIPKIQELLTTERQIELKNNNLERKYIR